MGLNCKNSKKCFGWQFRQSHKSCTIPYVFTCFLLNQRNKKRKWQQLFILCYGHFLFNVCLQIYTKILRLQKYSFRKYFFLSLAILGPNSLFCLFSLYLFYDTSIQSSKNLLIDNYEIKSLIHLKTILNSLKNLSSAFLYMMQLFNTW